PMRAVRPRHRWRGRGRVGAGACPLGSGSGSRFILSEQVCSHYSGRPALVNSSLNIYVHPMKKRPYRMTQRAESREETRARIVEAAVALHEEIGPRATTVSAIAERAGVQRLTVYRHLPDEEAMIRACSSHWAASNPAPDPARWDSIADPARRVRTALREFCAYYARTARMWASVRRDAADMPAVQVPLAAYDAHLQEV